MARTRTLRNGLTLGIIAGATAVIVRAAQSRKLAGSAQPTPAWPPLPPLADEVPQPGPAVSEPVAVADVDAPVEAADVVGVITVTEALDIDAALQVDEDLDLREAVEEEEDLERAAELAGSEISVAEQHEALEALDAEDEDEHEGQGEEEESEEADHGISDEEILAEAAALEAEIEELERLAAERITAEPFSWSRPARDAEFRPPTESDIEAREPEPEVDVEPEPDVHIEAATEADGRPDPYADRQAERRAALARFEAQRADALRAVLAAQAESEEPEEDRSHLPADYDHDLELPDEPDAAELDEADEETLVAVDAVDADEEDLADDVDADDDDVDDEPDESAGSFEWTLDDGDAESEPEPVPEIEVEVEPASPPRERFVLAKALDEVDEIDDIDDDHVGTRGRRPLMVADIGAEGLPEVSTASPATRSSRPRLRRRSGQPRVPLRAERLTDEEVARIERELDSATAGATPDVQAARADEPVSAVEAAPRSYRAARPAASDDAPPSEEAPPTTRPAIRLRAEPTTAEAIAAEGPAPTKRVPRAVRTSPLVPARKAARLRLAGPEHESDDATELGTTGVETAETTEASPAEPAAATKAPAEKAAAEKAATKKAPAKKGAAEKATAEKAPAKKAPAKKAPAEKAPAKKAPAKKAPAEKAPAKKAPAKKAPAEKAPAKKAPAEKAAAKKAPATKAAADKTPAKKTPATKVAAEKAPAEKAPATKAAAQKSPAKNTPATKTTAAKPPAEETPAKTPAPAEKAGADRATAKKAPAAKRPAKSAPPVGATGDKLWVEPKGDTCPTGHPIKASLKTQIYHVLGGLSYDRAKPDRCYAREADARVDGFRKAKR